MGKIIRYLLLPVCLFIVSTILSVWFYGEAYVTTIQVHHESLLSKDFFDSPLVQGKMLRGEVVAAHNNFGALKLRIKTYNRINYDKIHFRLREKGRFAWDVENAYIVDVFTNKLLYGFGFPPIPDSGGKAYEFELWSENGTPDDAIGFYEGYHPAASQYVFRRDTLLNNNRLLRIFLRAKSYSLLSDPYSVLYYSMFLVPLFFYVLLTLIKNKYILYGLEILVFAYMIAIYIFLPVRIHQDTSVYIFVLGVITLIANIYSSRRASSYAFVMSIGLLVLLEINIFLGNDFESTRVATGIFYSILFALIIANQELQKDKKRRG